MLFLNTQRLRRLCSLFLVLAVFVFASCSSSASSQGDGKPIVVASIFAYYDALRFIGGDDIHAVILLPARESPHEFHPTAQDKSTTMKARLLIKNGLEIDPWMDTLASFNKNATLLSIGDDEKILKTEETELPGDTTGPATAAAHDHTHESAASGNPHVWLDPTVQMCAAEKIRDELIKIDPPHRADYTARAATYISDLQKLDEDFKVSVATFKYKEFIGFHSAYDYLAHRYGLKQVASIAELGAGGLNAAQIKQVVEIINQRHIPVVFSETAFDSRQAETVTRQTGVKLGTLQPLETYDNLNDTYISLMRQNLVSLEKYMKN